MMQLANLLSVFQCVKDHRNGIHDNKWHYCRKGEMNSNKERASVEDKEVLALRV